MNDESKYSVYTTYSKSILYRQDHPLHVPCSGGWHTRVHCVDEGQSPFAIAAQLAGGLVIDIWPGMLIYEVQQ